MEKDDWSAYLEHQSMKQELEESPANRKAQLLFDGENRFGIYQLKDTEEARDIHFMGMDYFESKGIAVTRENYDLLYTAPLEEGTSLEDIYTRFNIDHPADFRGHSLSMWWCFIRTERTQAIMWIPLATGKCRSLQRSLWQSI